MSDQEAPRQKEIRGIVQREFEKVQETLFEALDDKVRRNQLTDEEALQGLEHIDNDLADQYRDWIMEGES